MAKRELPKSGEIYRHFKNKMYQIITVATHTETGEQLVVYEALYDDFKMYARPVSMFLSEVDHEKYPDVKQEYRFELIEREVDGTLKMGYPAKLNKVVKKEKTQEIEKEEVQKEVKIETKTTNIINEEKQENFSKESKIEKQENVSEEIYVDEGEEINPFLLEFLNTNSYSEKLEVLISIRSRLDDRLIDDMATALDVTVGEGPLPERYESLKTCLDAMVRFECGRLR